MDSADEHAVRGAGDEVADAVVVDESGHGVAVGRVSVVCGEDIAFTVRFFGLEAELPGFAAPRDGGVCGRRADQGAGFEKPNADRDMRSFPFVV